MKAMFLLLLLSSLAIGQAPQINLTGNLGCQGFPCLNNYPSVTFVSDADMTMTVVESSMVGGIKLLSSLNLTATRKYIIPSSYGNLQFIIIENATQGGQAIEVIGQTGTGVTIANGTAATVWFDGTNVVQSGSSTYTLPQATTTVLGGVKPDGTTCTTTAGVLSCPGSGGISGLTTGVYPIATSATAIGNGHLDETTNVGSITSSLPILAPSFGTTGTVPGKFSLAAGTGSIAALAPNSGGFAGPVTGGTSYLLKLPATITAGILHAAAPATGDGVNESVLTSSPVSLTADVSGLLPNANLANPSTTVNGVTCTLGSTCTVTASGIANVTTTVGTTAIAANTCTSAVTVAMTGVVTTSVFDFTPNSDVSGVTGWGSTGGLTIVDWPTADTLNYKVCNQTASSITPGASVTFNVGAR